ncbi:transposase, partial [Burkholderia gladioli]|uniref:transposase n=1 Tax=Burkholderia gladioli TaxID=28095 RepID=UPI003F794D5B
MSSFLPNIFSAVLGDAASLAGLPMQAVAGALGGEILDRLLKTRRERATEIMLEALKRGTTRVHPDDLEESVSVLYRYLRAAEEGAARRNLRLLADVFAGQVRGKAVAADEFLYQAVEIPRPIRHDIATLIPRREDRMRGADSYNESLFSTVRLEEFVPQTHPLRPIRTWVNEALSKMDAKFSAMYEADIKGGRPSIAPEKLMRAMLLQVLYSIRSERQLVEQISYNLLFRWFVGLSIEDTVWNHSVFTKNRDRLIEFDAVTDLFNATVETAHKRGLLSG